MNSIFSFMFTGKIECSVSSFKSPHPTAKLKSYQQNVTVGGALTVIGKALKMHQKKLIGVSPMNCLENKRSR